MIRKDLQDAEQFLLRLMEYSKAFGNFSREFSSLKNDKSFQFVYEMPFDEKRHIEMIYESGQGVAQYMYNHLWLFYDVSSCPTIKSFVEMFNGGWIDQVDDLKVLSKNAKNICSKLVINNYSIVHMIELYDRQIIFLYDIKGIFNAIKGTKIYKLECAGYLNNIDYGTYYKIIDCIDKVGKSFERNPMLYNNNNEEGLRYHIVSALEAADFGSATGETFNKSGKTDIILKKGSDNILVAECKIWSGEENYSNAISQLLSYISYRDKGAALIVFVRNRNFTSILSKIQNKTKDHKNYKDFVFESSNSIYHYTFNMNEDEDSIVNVAIMAYHIPNVIDK